MMATTVKPLATKKVPVKTVTPVKPKTTPIRPVALPQSKMTAEQKSYYDNFKNSLKSGTADQSQLARFNAIQSRYGLGQQMNSDQVNYYNTYGKQVQTGQNNLTGLDRYSAIQKRYNLFGSQINDDALRDMSIKALSGDANAANYLKSMKYKQMEGSKLWDGIQDDRLDGSESLRNAYMKANPTGEYTKKFDLKDYDRFNQLIQGNGSISDEDMNRYYDIVDKWNLEDLTDPFIGQQRQLESDRQQALSAQDVALNQGLFAQETSNFEQFQQLQQSMAERGITDSGIASDSYMRAQMGANANYQKAFADSAVTKSELSARFNEAISQSKLSSKQYKDERMAAREAAAQSAAADKAKIDQEYAKMKQQGQIDMLKIQSDRDKYMTSSTGYVYLDGKPMMSGGKPITSLEYKKMSEDQRHNLATENNTAIKNAQSYELGLDKNAISREKIAVDLQKSIAKNKIEYAKLDFDYKKLESTNAFNQDKIAIAAENAQTAKDKNQLTALGKQSNDLAKQIAAAQKAGKKPDKKIVDKYNQINSQISALVGSGAFKSEGGGGDNSLGSLSKKYESGSAGAGTIANNAGDWGGKSYGTYQIATNTGTMKSFMNYLKTANPRMYNGLGRYSIGSGGFDQAWKALAKADPEFEKMQQSFIQQSHYNPVVQNLRGYGVDINSRSAALQNVIWSMGVQHGSAGATNIWKNAGIKPGMSDSEIITRLYKERMNTARYFPSSSQSIKNSVYNRFQNELEDALAML